MAYLGSSLRLMIAAARYPSRDDGRPALTRSNLPAGSGNGRAASDSGQLNDRRYLSRTALPRPLKKKLLYWIFPASRAGAAGGQRHGVFQQRNTYTGGTTIYQALLRLNQKCEKLWRPPSNENWVARQYNTRQSKLLRTVNVK